MRARTGVIALSPVCGCSRPDDAQLSIEDWPANDHPWQQPVETDEVETDEQQVLDG